MIELFPNSRNVIPGRVWFTVDFRHPDDGALAEMDAQGRSAFADIARTAALDLQVEQIWQFDATPFDSSCIDAVRDAAEALGFSHRDIVSGAGHDAVYMARIAPAAMVFVPCEGGISHNEIENAAAEDLAAGCDVLLRALLRRADRTG
jgi:N-carbamoyl-L-amino-acid hydrolase